ncbi:MAG: hypothetical protein MJ095_07915 [Oscillospiraceae bacterium]|nr:hypothetical protein [Oscillospiraceae bacterium]
MRSRINRKYFSLTGIMLAVLTGLLLVMFIKVIPENRHAAETGSSLGSESGKKVGMYLGSYQGIKAGMEESQKQGLSASELSAKLSEIMQKTGEVQILSASVDTDFYGNLTGTDPERTTSSNTAVFFINLSQATVSVSGDTILSVKLPEPECRIFDTAGNTEIANGKESVSSDMKKEARRIAADMTEEIADIVCGKMCSFTVSYEKSEGGDSYE